MQVYKFGGASVKDANSVKNVARVLSISGHKRTFMVLSAMGKSTNALESIVSFYFEKKDTSSLIEKLKNYHQEIALELFPEEHLIFSQIKQQFQDLSSFLNYNKSPNYSYVYDQVVTNGELISTKIVSAYLNLVGITNQWIDARDYLKTDNNYQEALVDWEATEKNISELNPDLFYITQGFIASDENHFTTTLGREGSDYSASIFAYCLNAKNLSIWKDVDGVLNADPRYFDTQELLHHISYEEAIELAYYGASVIHPKTLQPLQHKGIPLYVKSFIDPKKEGTSVKSGLPLEPHIPCFILKKNLSLLNISSKNFSFIAEKNLSDIFKFISDHKIKINLIQNSAISLSVVLEDKFNNLDKLIKTLEQNYNLSLHSKVDLYTIRHYTQESIEIVEKRGIVILKQFIKDTAQFIIKN